MRYLIFLMTAGLAVTSGCTSVSVDDYENAGPDFHLEEYFDGDTRAWGLFEDRMGNVRRQFVVDISGHWDGNTLTLTEDFRYSDGETENREWKITKTGANSYIGTTANSVGTAVGRAAGNAFNWKYDFNLAVGDSTWKVRFDDWMFLQPNGVVLNKATVSRWGFKIGTVFLSFEKIPELDRSKNSQSDRLISRSADLATDGPAGVCIAAASQCPPTEFEATSNSRLAVFGAM
jgi:hypothetical protein